MMAKNIDDLNLDVKTFNRLKKAGINSVDELLAEMYAPSSKISQPDAKRCEEVLKTAGIIKYMRGDEVEESDIEPEPLTWKELHSYIGKLVVKDYSTESHRWLVVCWIYDISNEGEGRATYISNSRGYCYSDRSTVNGVHSSTRLPNLKHEGQFFALKTAAVPQTESGTPLDDLGLSVRTYNAAKRFGIDTVEQLEERIDEFCGHAAKCGEEARELLASRAKPAPVIVESSEYTKAVKLHRCICANAQAAQDSLYEMCKALKEMHDGKLYIELGYKNFEDYCESEVGIKRRQAYGYISVASSLSKDFVHSSAQIGIKKLELLAKLDEPQREELQQTVDVDEVSVKELKAEIDKLKDAQKGYKERQDKLLTRNKELVKELEDSEACRDKLSSDLNESRDTVMSLERQIEELENKPVDVYENTAKINELTAKITELEVENAAKLARLKSEYEGKTAGEPEVCRAVFQAYLTSAADALHRLCDFAEEHKPSEEFNYYIARINKLISCAESETARIGGK